MHDVFPIPERADGSPRPPRRLLRRRHLRSRLRVMAVGVRNVAGGRLAESEDLLARNHVLHHELAVAAQRQGTLLARLEVAETDAGRALVELAALRAQFDELLLAVERCEDAGVRRQAEVAAMEAALGVSMRDLKLVLENVNAQARARRMDEVRAAAPPNGAG